MTSVSKAVFFTRRMKVETLRMRGTQSDKHQSNSPVVHKAFHIFPPQLIRFQSYIKSNRAPPCLHYSEMCFSITRLLKKPYSSLNVNQHVTNK